MKSLLRTLSAAALVLFVIAVLIIPVGIRTGVAHVSFGATPAEDKAFNREGGRQVTNDAYRTEVACKYFVRDHIDAIPTWAYSDSSEPSYPHCAFLTFYWNNDWLVSHNTEFF